jgi:aspartyl-tRNA(Asn)/glutamyl-tRNA(Gln) amidotransferase subunit A
MTGVELADLGIAELLGVYARKEASPSEAIDAHLARIDRLDPQVGAVLTFCWERAGELAAESTQRWMDGRPRPLEGVPYGLKDIIETAGIRTTGGSRMYADHVPSKDAAVASRLAGAGGVLLAKLQTFEFAAGANAVTSNPWDLARTAAGSSSGSGAAVAARELPLSIGTDTGGSVAIPASFVGIAGLKATFGRVPRSGVFPLSWTLDHVGPMARSAEDIALALGVMAGHDADDPTSGTAAVPDYAAELQCDLSTLRIGVPTDWFFDIIHPDVELATRAAIAAMEAAGAEVVEFALPSAELLDLHAMELTIIGAEAASLHSPHLSRYDLLGPEFQQVLARSQGYSAVDYLNAVRARHLVQRDFARAFEIADVIVVPGAITVAPRHDHLVAVVGDSERPWVDVVSRSTAVFNLTGIPSLSIPAGFSDGLPVGIQIAGPPYAEGVVLAAAHAYQQLTDHHAQIPQLVADDSAQPHPGWDPSQRNVPDEAPVITRTLDSTW